MFLFFLPFQGPLELPPHARRVKMSSLKEGHILEMGTNGLMLNIITPLQKFSKGGTTLSDVVRQRYQDLFRAELTTQTLQGVEEYFTKKKEVSKS